MKHQTLEHFFIASPGVLGVRTNRRDFKWSFGLSMPTANKEAFNACALRLDLSVVPDEGFIDNGALPGACGEGKYHYFVGVPNEDKLCYHRPFFLKSRLLLEAGGLLSGEPKIRVNRTYYRYVSHRFMNLHSVGYLMTDIAALLLLRRGYVALHCSAFKLGEQTVVVFAPPNTGKTLTTMMACLDYGADFLAEDLAISDGSFVYPVPWTSTFRYYPALKDGFAAHLVNKLTRVIPVLELVNIGKRKPVTEYVEFSKIAQRSQITDLVLLERADADEVIESSPEQVIDKLVNLNRFEFWYAKSPLITAYEYFNPALDVSGAVEAERMLLLKTAESAQQRLVVRTSDPTRYASLIIGALQ